MPQDAGQRHDIVVGLYPVGGEGVPERMDASMRQACVVEHSPEGSVHVVAVSRMTQSVGKDAGAAPARFVSIPRATSPKALL